MAKTRRRKSRVNRKRKRTKRKQKGGIIPLAAAIPTLVAAGKAAAMGGISAGVGFGVRKGSERATKPKKRKRDKYMYIPR